MIKINSLQPDVLFYLYVILFSVYFYKLDLIWEALIYLRIEKQN